MTVATHEADGERPPARLDAGERAALCPDVDPDEVERLLSMLPAEVRPGVLRFFRNWEAADPEDVLAAFPEIVPEGPPGRRSFLLPLPEQLHFEHPALQAQLERVLADRRLWWTPADAAPGDAGADTRGPGSA